MNQKENKPQTKGFLFYLVLAVLYALSFGVVMVVFPFFTNDEIHLGSILYQSIAFGLLMGGFEYWRINRKKRE